MHITYFTAWVDEKGETQMASDVYGHEKRITLALAGKWEQIVKGPNHLAPVELNRVEEGFLYFGSSRKRPTERRRLRAVGAGRRLLIQPPIRPGLRRPPLARCSARSLRLKRKRAA